MSSICRLCELGFQAYARSVGFGVIPNASILAGFDDLEHERKLMTPRLVFNCDTAEPEANWDDIVWSCQLEVQCVSNCDDTAKGDHQDFCDEVFSQFKVGRYTLPELITAAAAANNPPVRFFCQDVLYLNEIKTIQERRWISSLILKVSCCSIGVASTDPTEPPDEVEGVMDEGGGLVLDEGGGVVLPG